METEVEQVESQETEQESGMEFYSVSTKKFLIMYFGTFGIYSLYWFYKHWSLYKTSGNKKLIPIMKAIFSIFFTHALFSLFEKKYHQKTGEYPRSIRSLATIYVVIGVIGYIGAIINGDGRGLTMISLFGFIALPIASWCLYQAQSLANYASNDVLASENNKLTLLNYAWLLVGALYWLLAIVGLLNSFAAQAV
ncbi:hypothetical protein OFY17_09685 [Marinomonas sp. C2222]|uniref:DUF4234 domain-containing protein n=1 Tax=Marinomonas sargassi TaxID=2984494 RepID=A0ABT2YTC7_9GAMM|nr:hypothetical protein [Marinomonas sargassi]MCV2403147.1 hypothetical protein [Marinomonas sargassi]